MCAGLCVCLSICVCLCVYACVCVCMCVCVRVCAYVCMCGRVCVCDILAHNCAITYLNKEQENFRIFRGNHKEGFDDPQSLNRHTCVPIPRLININMKRMAHSGEMGNLVTASGYAIKARPGPVKHGFIKMKQH